jgi:hypothetical protein
MCFREGITIHCLVGPAASSSGDDKSVHHGRLLHDTLSLSLSLSLFLSLSARLHFKEPTNTVSNQGVQMLNVSGINTKNIDDSKN